MVNTPDPRPASTASDGRHKIAFVPWGENVNPLSVAVLKAETTENMTYSFTPDGFDHVPTQATVEDKRYTLPQDLSRPGKVTDALTNKYVDSTAPKSAAVLLTQDTLGWFVRRKGIANEIDWAAGQTVTAIPFMAGVQREAAPTENGVDLIEQTQFITDTVLRRVKTVA
ncbi:hypothetical protein NY057_05280 [Curtobacterium flaccumfaciens]|uniref:phage tail tube protein n=1 Tax=Curtobacterium flaccumfaciens TaxID=2035 RepID=UPI0022088B46|nr:hypothetical protein [Curtobacterium flaccumfaciens]UWD83658.1 hypothetical protein NY057_05280 [Curtobacterium flaccumfaciens]